MKKTLSVAGLVVSVVLAAACERGGQIIVDPGEAPGVGASTLESDLDPSVVESWTDTVFLGFAGPENATFLQVEEGTGVLASRGLIRFGFIEDSVFIVDTLSGTQRFDSARIVLTVDNSLTVLSSAGTTVQIVEVKQEWDRGSANWENAVDSVGVVVPWTDGMGGSFGAVLGETTLTEEADSVVIWLGAAGDSLLKAWLDTTQVNTGLGILVGDSGRVVLQLPRIHYEIIPEVNPDTAIELRVLATDGTFIFDRTAAGAPAGVLRVGGIDGYRIFMDVVIPDSIPVEGSNEKSLLRGATINKAELFLVSLSAPEVPFGAEVPFFITAYDLADDFTIIGPKTPVGGLLFGTDVDIIPDSLQAGDTLAINLTGRIQTWADTPADSTLLPVRIVIRALPEATTFGFWEFGAADGDPAFRPVLRVVFTRPTEFPLP